MNPQLLEFAQYVLRTLAADREWTFDTIDRIAAEAISRGLAGTDAGGFFNADPGALGGQRAVIREPNKP